MRDINNLPEDIVYVIKSFIPSSTLVWLNSSYYDNYKKT